MNSFSIELHDATHMQRIDGVTSFVGEDASGSFGIMANHTLFMTMLSLGLARFRIGEGEWSYIAVPGALLYFANNTLTISTRHYLVEDDYDLICKLLDEELLAEEENLKTTKESLQRMEEEMFKRLWTMRRQEMVL